MTLLFIDLGSCYWNAWHSSANEPVSAAHDRCVRHVRFLREKFEHAHCAIACDSPHSFRREKYPTYKAQRDAKDKAAIEQLRRVKQTLEADGLLLWECDGFEADDVLAAAVRHAREHEETVLIASADKDLLQMVNDEDGVRVVSTKTDVIYDENAVLDKLGVWPRQVRDWLALVGDSSDNIAGVPKVGAKTAADLLKRFDNLEMLMAALVRDPASVSTPAIVKSLQESRDILKVGIDLVTLRSDAPINFEELFEERKVKPLTDVSDAEFEDESSDANESWPIGEAESAPSPAAADATPVPDSASRAAGPRKTAPTEVPRETALAVAPQRNFELSLQPESINGAFKLANGLYNSRLYTRFPTPEAIMAVIIRGREMGMGALTALDNFHIVEGKPTPGAHLLIARARAHEDCEYFMFVGGDATYAEFETKNRRNPKPTKLRYTIDEAKKAGMLEVKPGKQPGNWHKRPAEMLRKTCAVQLARIEYPEATAGLYSIEELEGEAA